MQLVIDISEKDYKSLKHGHIPLRMLDVVMKGVPLPKGHGRLIDADAFKKKVCTYQQTGCGDCKHSLCCPEDVPTIIEADKEESEDNEEEYEYQRQVEQYQYNTRYEPTFDPETGSM